MSSKTFLIMKGTGVYNLSDSFTTRSKYFSFKRSSFTVGLSESPKTSYNLQKIPSPMLKFIVKPKSISKVRVTYRLEWIKVCKIMNELGYAFDLLILHYYKIDH